MSITKIPAGMLAQFGVVNPQVGDVLSFNGTDWVNGPLNIGNATTTTPGKVELATMTEVKQAAGGALAVSPSALKAAIGFSKVIPSPEITITPDSANTYDHGLGITPMLFRVVLVCKVADNGYAIDDELTDIFSRANGDVNSVFGTFANATQVGITIDDVITVNIKNSSSLGNLTLSRWRFKFYVWG